MVTGVCGRGRWLLRAQVACPGRVLGLPRPAHAPEGARLRRSIERLICVVNMFGEAIWDECWGLSVGGGGGGEVGGVFKDVVFEPEDVAFGHPQ